MPCRAHEDHDDAPQVTSVLPVAVFVNAFVDSDGDDEDSSKNNKKDKNQAAPQWQALSLRGEANARNLSCGRLGQTHYRAVARKEGLADSDVAHLYIDIIRYTGTT